MINKCKLRNNNIIYYIFILIKSLFILLKFNKIINITYHIYIYLLLIYIIILYNIYSKFSYIYINFNYIYFYIYKYYIRKYNINTNNNNLGVMYNYIEKIIDIKKVSYTIKKGRIKRYKIIILIGNKCGWVGVGIGKHININKAIINAKINAFHNIYYFKYSLLNIYKLKFVYVYTNKLFMILKLNIFNYLNIKFLIFKYLLECLGYLNCKIIIYHSIMKNKLNLLNKLLVVLFHNINNI